MTHDADSRGSTSAAAFRITRRLWVTASFAAARRAAGTATIRVTRAIAISSFERLKRVVWRCHWIGQGQGDQRRENCRGETHRDFCRSDNEISMFWIVERRCRGNMKTGGHLAIYIPNVEPDRLLVESYMQLYSVSREKYQLSKTALHKFERSIAPTSSAYVVRWLDVVGQ